jgi:hypothetical protein
MKGTKNAGHLALGGFLVLLVCLVVAIFRSTKEPCECSNDVQPDSASSTSRTSTTTTKKKQNLALDIVNKACESTCIAFDEACTKGEPFSQCVTGLNASPLRLQLNIRTLLSTTRKTAILLQSTCTLGGLRLCSVMLPIGKLDCLHRGIGSGLRC